MSNLNSKHHLAASPLAVSIPPSSDYHRTMKAIRYHAFGGPEVLTVDKVAIPQAGPGQIRIAVHCSGVNPSD